MSKEDRIREILGSDGGLKVPEGFFETRFKEICDNLPEYPASPVEERLSTWHRVRPYLYMAAMFAGIWLMMQMFHNVSTRSLSLDNIPDNIAVAMQQTSEPDFSIETSSQSAVEDFELVSEASSDYRNIDDFIDDFGYDLSPVYDKIQIKVSNL